MGQRRFDPRVPPLPVRQLGLQLGADGIPKSGWDRTSAPQLGQGSLRCERGRRCHQRPRSPEPPPAPPGCSSALSRIFITTCPERLWTRGRPAAPPHRHWARPQTTGRRRATIFGAKTGRSPLVRSPRRPGFPVLAPAPIWAAWTRRGAGQRHRPVGTAGVGNPVSIIGRAERGQKTVRIAARS